MVRSYKPNKNNVYVFFLSFLVLHILVLYRNLTFSELDLYYEIYMTFPARFHIVYTCTDQQGL